MLCHSIGCDLAPAENALGSLASCGVLSITFSIKRCLASCSYQISDTLRLAIERAFSPHLYEQVFLTRMSAVETLGVRPVVFSSSTGWSSVLHVTRKNRRLLRNYTSAREFV